VPSSGNPYVDTNSATELVQSIKHRLLFYPSTPMLSTAPMFVILLQLQQITNGGFEFQIIFHIIYTTHENSIVRQIYTFWFIKICC